MTPLYGFIFQQFGMQEILLIMGVALLLFGKRLPEVGRSLGKGIVEFKKGLKGIEDDVDAPPAPKGDPAELPRPPQRVTPASPRFEDAGDRPAAHS
jgi:sec-independent protein translocase protein TatA